MLSVEDLQFNYGDGRLLAGLDLAVEAGELVGIVGPNGTGKTTLLRLISGIYEPLSGRIVINKQDIGLLTAHDLSKLVSIVPQNPQLPAGFTVTEIVLLARNPYLKLFQWERIDDLKVAEVAMMTTETIELADRQFSTLSGGERQRVMIAMALTQNAQVMLLDEPISNLDLSHQIRVMDLVVNLVRSHKKIGLIAMHDLSLAAQYCDRIVMIAGGMIFADGTPSQVLTATNISAVYGADVIVISHPVTGMPVVLPSSGVNAGS